MCNSHLIKACSQPLFLVFKPLFSPIVFLEIMQSEIGLYNGSIGLYIGLYNGGIGLYSRGIVL